MTKPMISRDASQRLAVELCSLPINAYPEVCIQIAAAFGLSCCGELITNGIDVIINDFSSVQFDVEIAWDNWSGLVVTAKTPASEPLIHQICKWLECLEIATQN